MPIIGSGPITTTTATGIAANLGLRIGGTDVVDWLAIESYEIVQAMNQRNTCSLLLFPPSGSAWHPQVGEEFILTDSGERLFGGSVENVTEQTLDESLLERRSVRVEAVDFNQLADRHLVVAVYQGQSCGAIVNDLITNYLAADNVAAAFVDEGVTVDQVTFNYVSVSEALNKLATLSGFSWNIDYYGGLYFFARTFQPSLYHIDSNNAVFKGLRSTATRDQYRNSQVVQGGTAVTVPQLEKFSGDGQVTTFTTTYPLDQVPSIMRNTTSTGAAQSVEIRDLGVAANWYWNKGQNQFNQHSTDVVLTSTEFVTILYRGEYPLLTVVDNPGEIANRAAIEGGSGRYESVVSDASVDNDNLGMLEANGLLAQYGSIKQDIDFVTTRVPVNLGDLLPVSVPELGVSGQFLATNVRIKNWRLADREYSVTATNGQFRGDFVEFFRVLSAEGPVKENDNAIVARPVAVTETLTFTDSISVSTLMLVGSNEWGTAVWGLSEWTDIASGIFTHSATDTVPVIAGDARPSIVTGAGVVVKGLGDDLPIQASDTALSLSGGAALKLPIDALTVQVSDAMPTLLSGTIVLKPAFDAPVIQVSDATPTFGPTTLSASDTVPVHVSDVAPSNTRAFPLSSILDAFDRADENPLGNGTWSGPILPGSAQLKLVSTEVTTTSITLQSEAYWLSMAGADQEVAVTVVHDDGTDGNMINVHLIIDQPNTTNVNDYELRVIHTGGVWQWFWRRRDSFASTTVIGPTVVQAVSAGDSIGVRRLGHALEAWYQPGSGSWTRVLATIDGTYVRNGYLGVRLGSASVAGITVDTFRGGSV